MRASGRWGAVGEVLMGLTGVWVKFSDWEDG